MPLLDAGVLAIAIDGYVKNVALELQITPQRVHQLIANDPFASFMRIHRAVAKVAPERAEQVSVYFNATHDGLLMKRALPSAEQVLSNVALFNGKSLSAALSPADINVKLQEAFNAQRALADYIEILMRQMTEAKSADNVTPFAAGGQRK